MLLDALPLDATPPDAMIQPLLAAAAIADVSQFDANLAAAMPDGERDAIAEELLDLAEGDIRAREDWDRLARRGQQLMGLAIDPAGRAMAARDQRDQDFWHTKVVHPLLAEAIVRFQAQAASELFPPEGPAKAAIVPNRPSVALEEQAERVARLINWIATDECPEYGDQTDRLLFLVALDGVVYTKVTYDQRRFISRLLVRSHDVFLPWHATTFDEASRITHRMRWHPQRIARLQRTGYLLPDVVLSGGRGDDDERLQVERAADRTVGLDAVTDYTAGDRPIEILEIATDYALAGTGLPDDDEAPYVFTIARADRRLLAVRRNWREADHRRRPLRHLTQWPFVLGDHPGPYAYGLPHLIGSLSETATGVLRSAFDIAAKQASPPGFIQSAILNNPDFNRDPLRPGELRETPTTIEDLQRAIFMMPAGDAGPLVQVLQFIVEAGQRFASTADLQVGVGDNRAPVGTTLAMIEQGSRVYSSIHARLHRAQRRELRMIADLIGEYTPDDQPYPYPIGGEILPIKPDFDGRVDVVPVSDPRITSMAHRLASAQAVYQLAVEQPGLYDSYEVNYRVLSALRIADPDQVLKRPDEAEPRDAVGENMAMLFTKPVRAFYEQDHDAHMAVHQSWFAGLPAEGQQPLLPVFMAHMAEHVAYRYRTQMEQAVSQVTGQPPGAVLPPPPLPGDSLRARSQPAPDPQQMAIADAAAAQAAQLMAASGMAPASPPPDPQQIKAEAAARDAETRAILAKAKTELEQQRLELERAIAAGKVQLEGAIAEGKLKLEGMRLDLERERLRQDGALAGEKMDQDMHLRAADMVMRAETADRQRTAAAAADDKQIAADLLRHDADIAADRDSQEREHDADREALAAQLASEQVSQQREHDADRESQEREHGAARESQRRQLAADRRRDKDAG